MSISNEIPAVQRPAFFDGQRLTAADLTAVQDYQRELRWLHNRSLHTWGIAFGLEVLAKRGDRSVTVQVGYALDCLGRDLLVNAAISLPVPPVSGSATSPATYYLTISYLEDEDLPPELRQGECDANGAVRLPEKARLRWQQPEDSQPESRYRHGYDVILASIQVQNCKLAAEPSPKQRREARPASQPYVAAGNTGSAIAWQAVKFAGQVIGLKTAVDTSAAGFGAMPQYLAHVVGERLVPGTENILLDGLVNISAATPVSFTLTLLMPPDVPLGGGSVLNSSKYMHDELPSLVSEWGWSVTWLGIEG
jgi:hypothetical protein